MKNRKINSSIKITVLLLCLVSINKGMAQLSANLMSDKIMKPVFVQIEKREKPVQFGVGLETYASGNSHGAFYSARLHISKGKSVYSSGPCLQKRSLELNGFKVGYSYLLSGINDRYDAEELEEMKDAPKDILELRMLCFVQYIHKAPLSYRASRVETITNEESRMNFNEIRLSTIEVALGMELDINLKVFKIRTYMGATIFYHPDYINGMYRSKYSPALFFGTGIIIPHL